MFVSETLSWIKEWINSSPIYKGMYDSTQINLHIILSDMLLKVMIFGLLASSHLILQSYHQTHIIGVSHDMEICLDMSLIKVMIWCNVNNVSDDSITLGPNCTLHKFSSDCRYQDGRIIIVTSSAGKICIPQINIYQLF